MIQARAIFFDLYNTLARFEPPREELQAQVAAAFGLKVTRAGILLGYVQADALMSLENAREPIRQRSPEAQTAFFARYEQAVFLGAGVEVPLEVAAQMWQRLRQLPYDLALFDDVLPSLAELKQRGLTIGLISNLSRNLDQLCQRLGLAPYLDVVVSSGQVGSEKPHAPVFQAALAKAGVPAAQAVHVGDQYHTDVVGARAVGMIPVLLDREGLLDHHGDCLKVSGLKELLGLLQPAASG